MTTAFPLTQHKVKLTVGTVTGTIVHCEVTGTIDITWQDGSTLSAYEMVSGEDRSLGSNVKSVTIVSGTFSVA